MANDKDVCVPVSLRSVDTRPLSKLPKKLLFDRNYLSFKLFEMDSFDLLDVFESTLALMLRVIQPNTVTSEQGEAPPPPRALRDMSRRMHTIAANHALAWLPSAHQHPSPP